MPSGIYIREIDPRSDAEVELVAKRMRATLIEVEGEATGAALYGMEWLRQRVRWHLDGGAVAAKVYVALEAGGEIVGHAIFRREVDAAGAPYGLVATTYVAPTARRRGVAAALLRAGEAWMQSESLPSAATWTSSTNAKLIRFHAKHGYAQTATHVHDVTGTLMVKLERRLTEQALAGG